MPYTLRKLNGSWHDLSDQEQVDWYNKIMEAVYANGLRSLTQPVIVQFIKDYGGEKTMEGIAALIGRGNWSPATLDGILQGSIPKDRPSPATGIPERYTGSGRSRIGDSAGDAKSLKDIVSNMNAYKVIEHKPLDRPELFTEAQVHLWMNENGLTDSGFYEYFEQYGLDQHGDPVYKKRENVKG